MLHSNLVEDPCWCEDSVQEYKETYVQLGKRLPFLSRLLIKDFLDVCQSSDGFENFLDLGVKKPVGHACLGLMVYSEDRDQVAFEQLLVESIPSLQAMEGLELEHLLGNKYAFSYEVRLSGSGRYDFDFIRSEKAIGAICYYRIVVPKESSVELYLRYLDIEDSLIYLDIHIEDGATCKVFDLGSAVTKGRVFNRVNYFVQRDASLFYYLFNCDMVGFLQGVNVFLDGNGSQVDFKNINLLSKSHLAKYYWKVYHRAQHTSSYTTVRNLVYDQAKLIHRVTAIVSQEGPGAFVEQDLKTLGFSNDNRVESVPELEISTDDIQASHGSTIGCLDQQALFYLMSRGISRDDAERLLIEAFVGEFVEKEHLSRLFDVIQT